MKRKDAANRFWAKVDQRGVDDCWDWKAGKDKDGYGLYNGALYGQQVRKAHRFAYMLFRGAIPEGANICHTCDNPSCVNPRHLYAGSPASNMQDKMERGRSNIPRGEDSPHARITEEVARKILIDPRRYDEIAAEYGVSFGTVSNIKNKHSWAHLKDAAVKVHGPGSGSGHRGVSDRITPDIVRSIRMSTESLKVVAERYGISIQSVCDIRKRRSWKHVEDATPLNPPHGVSLPPVG